METCDEKCQNTAHKNVLRM